MGTPTPVTIACPKCGTRFKWRDDMAGRKVSCKCGTVFQAVAPTPPPSESAERNPYDLYDDGDDTHVGAKAAKPDKAPQQATVRADHPALQAARKLARERVVMEEADDDASPGKNLYFPIALIVAGVALRFGQAIYVPGDRGPVVAAALGLLELVLSAGVMLGGAALAAQLVGITFGRLGPTILKLVAVAVFAAGVSAVVTMIDASPDSIRGRVIALHAVVILYFILLTYLFGLDLQESLMSVVIIALLQVGLSCVLWTA